MRPKGYSNGMIAPRGRTLYLAGQVAWNAEEKLVAEDFAGQCRQIFRNIVAIVVAAGGRPEHIVRMTWFITDKEAYFSQAKEIGAAYREEIGRHFPAMSVVVVRELIEEGAKLEIEATAVVPE
jgi:enamine deaminase RidA (YjgF/YER057c/UK114 family)